MRHCECRASHTRPSNQAFKVGQIEILEMDDSAREAGPPETKKPNGKDNEADNTNMMEEGRLLEPFCTRGEQVSEGARIPRGLV